MGYGIMRYEKRKSEAVGGIQKENCRTKEQHENGLKLEKSLHVDWDRTQYNTYLKHGYNWKKIITKRLKSIEDQTGKKTRKDAVVMIDALFTASREFFDLPTDVEAKEYEYALKYKLDDMTFEERQAYFNKYNEYFSSCLEFYTKEFCQGDSSRILNAVIHYDEATPHMHVTSIPVFTSETGDRLSCKVVLGGKVDFRHHQDRFFTEVSSHYGLERGEIRTDPAEMKAHLTSQELQIARQEEILDRQYECYQKNHEIITEQAETYKQNEKLIQEQRETLDRSLDMQGKVIMAELKAENENLKKENNALKEVINRIEDVLQLHNNPVFNEIKAIIKRFRRSRNIEFEDIFKNGTDNERTLE